MSITVNPSLETLRLEALANPFEMLNPVVKAHLSAFTKSTAETMRSSSIKLLSLTKLHKTNNTLKYTVVKQQLSKSDYIEHTDIMLPIPTGLNIPLVDYIDLLSSAWVMSRDFAEKTIKYADEYVSTIIAYPGRMGHLEENSMVEVIPFHTDKIEAVKLTLDNAFEKTKPRQERCYGDLFARDKDFLDTVETYFQLSRDYGTRDNKTLVNRVNQLAEKSSLLHTRIKQGKLDITTKTAENLSRVLDLTAMEVEFYAAISQLIEEIMAKFSTILEVVNTRLSAS